MIKWGLVSHLVQECLDINLINNMKKTLYKLDKKFNKTQQWSVETQDNQYRTIEGYIDGKFTTSDWTTCNGKNIGKSNETTPNQQAILEAEAKVTKKLENGYFEDINQISLGKSYIEPMLAHKYDDYKDKPEKLNNQGRLLSQPKLDGIRCIATSRGLFTRNGKPIVSAPHILEEIKHILEQNPSVLALDGELYNHELKNDFNEIVSIVKKIKPTNEDLQKSKELMQYHVYDLIYTDDMTFIDRSKLLSDIMFDSNFILKYNYIHLVSPVFVSGKDCIDIDTMYGSYLEQGYEGQMIRKELSLYEHKRSQSLLKRKEFIDEECLILDVIEGKGNRSGMAGNLRLKHPNGNLFDSNIRGNYDFYKELLLNKDKYIFKYATIRYFSLTTDNIPRFPVMITIRDFE